MDYRDSGFDQFLKRKTSFAGVEPSEQTGDDTSHNIKRLSGTSISSGVSKSSDNKLEINWDKASFITTDGARNRVEIGKLPGTELYGMRVYDSSGNLLFSTSGITADGLADGIITVNKLAANSVTSDKIVADAVTADKLNVTQLDAVATNTGTLTVDESITVGGAANGTISVKDSSNNEKVLLDNTGLTINTGKITLKDSAETTIIDATGLVSTANFDVNSTTQTADQTITTVGTWIDLDGDSFTIGCDRDTVTLILFHVQFALNATNFSSDFGAHAEFAINIGGTKATFVSYDSDERVSGVGGGRDKTIGFHVVATLPSGTTVVKAQAHLQKNSGFDPGLYIRVSTLSAVRLGK